MSTAVYECALCSSFFIHSAFFNEQSMCICVMVINSSSSLDARPNSAVHAYCRKFFFSYLTLAHFRPWSQSVIQSAFFFIVRQTGKVLRFLPSSSADNRLDHRVQCRGGKKGKCFGSIAMMQKKNLHHCASIDRFLKLTVEGNCRHSVSLCLRCAMFNDRQIAGDGNRSKEVDYTAN